MAKTIFQTLDSLKTSSAMISVLKQYISADNKQTIDYPSPDGRSKFGMFLGNMFSQVLDKNVCKFWLTGWDVDHTDTAYID